jgi:Domain of unknown function (DUF4169)
MTEIVNLRLTRKRKRRAEQDEAATANRLAHGCPKAEKTRADRVRALDATRLEGHRREPGRKD